MKFKKIFGWVWNFMVASVITGSILITVAFSMATYVNITKIQDQLVESYDVSVKTQNTIVKQGKLNQTMLLYIIGQKKGTKKQLEEINKRYSERLKAVQDKINNRIEDEKFPSYEYLKKVTVRLFEKENVDGNKGWIGTGIIVKVTEDFTYILTNKHIATIGTHVFVNKNGKLYKVEILKNSAFVDLALVRLDEKFPDKKAVRGFADHVIQEKVYSVGMYLGNSFIYTEGSVAGLGILGDLLVNLPFATGCSGSGIFNSKGEVVGLLWGGNYVKKATYDTSKARCVPTSAIKVFLREFI